MLYTLNVHHVICQLYFIKAWKTVTTKKDNLWNYMQAFTGFISWREKYMIIVSGDKSVYLDWIGF